jgi:hypothetical protein
MGPDPGTGFWSGRNFWLDFDCDLCNQQFLLAASSDSSILANITSGSAFIYINQPEFPNTIGDKSLPGTITFGGFCDDPDNCFVQQTPEPATLGLIAGALGGAWLTGRRKKKPVA